jgi:hypothetical protein
MQRLYLSLCTALLLVALPAYADTGDSQYLFDNFVKMMGDKS